MSRRYLVFFSDTGMLESQVHKVLSLFLNNLPEASSAEEKMLLDSGLLFREPDSPAVLSTGGGRHWPEGRGVFVLEPKDDSSAMTAWINEEEHFKIMVASWMNMIDLGGFKDFFMFTNFRENYPI